MSKCNVIFTKKQLPYNYLKNRTIKRVIMYFYNNNIDKLSIHVLIRYIFKNKQLNINFIEKQIVYCILLKQLT